MSFHWRPSRSRPPRASFVRWKAVAAFFVLTALQRNFVQWSFYASNPFPPAGSIAREDDCAPREGVIVSNLLGPFAQNLLQIALALRLSEELCWNVVYRPALQSELPDEKTARCFPHANLPANHRVLNMSRSLERKLGIHSEKLREEIMAPTAASDGANNNNVLYSKWVNALGEEGLAARIENPGDGRSFNFSKRAVERLRDSILNNTSEPALLNMDAVIINNLEWAATEVWEDKIRTWFTVDESCCTDGTPDEDTVVVHVGNNKDNTVQPSVLHEILSQYSLTSRPLWIVSEKDSATSAQAQRLARSTLQVSNVTIVSGQDFYDTFCVLTRAKALILNSVSSLGRMSALVSNATQVHQLVVEPDEQAGMLTGQRWKYHLLNESLDRIEVFDLGGAQIRPPRSESPTRMGADEGDARHRSCKSLFLVGGSNEHSPLVFERARLMVCRTPKVASTLLRSIAQAYLNNMTNLEVTEESLKAFNHRAGNTLDRVADNELFSNLLFGSETQRLQIVRHPVSRILSGFLELANVGDFWTKLYGFDKPHGRNPEGFELWLTNSSFVQEYDPDCGNTTLTYSLDPWRQHWTPPQHCRCGISDCGVDWKVLRLEEESVGQTMAKLLSLPWLNETQRANTRGYDPNLYLTERVLGILNPLTRKEQKFFGYLPYASEQPSA